MASVEYSNQLSVNDAVDVSVVILRFAVLASMDVWIPLTLDESFFIMHPALPSLHGLVGLSLSRFSHLLRMSCFWPRDQGGGNNFERMFAKFGLSFHEHNHGHTFTVTHVQKVLFLLLFQFKSSLLFLSWSLCAFQGLKWANFFPHPTGLPVDLWTGSRHFRQLHFSRLMRSIGSFSTSCSAGDSRLGKAVPW